jgi:PRC-barrel domain
MERQSRTTSPDMRERDYDNRDSERDFPIDESHALIASNKVEGTAVYNRAGDRLGSIHNFMVGKQSGKVEYAVLTFGGFLGMGGNYYPLPWKMLNYDTDQGGYVVDIDEDDLDKAPSYREGAEPEFDRTYATTVYGYYGLPY